MKYIARVYDEKGSVIVEGTFKNCDLAMTWLQSVWAILEMGGNKVRLELLDKEGD